jgi:eukaryotic-like serine/threonine-protein kinase
MMERLTNEDPSQIGPYRPIARIGRGGMGIVYLAESDGGENVAVKVLRTELARDPAFLARFRREIAACQRVGGVCCAHYLDADVDASPPWLATEYVAGPNLAEHVGNRGPISGLRLVGLAAGIAEGLAAIHSAGLVHRDLKPANVILSLEGPRLIDFGIANHTDDTSLTAPGTVVGSPGWMAPEQLRGDEIGPAADVWAWGATVAYAAAGRPPFGTGPAPEVAQRVLSGLPDLAGISEPLAGRVRAALAPDPRARPSATELIADASKPASPDAITTVLADTWRPANDTLLLPPVRRHRWRWPISAGAAVTVAALAAIVAAVLTTGGSPTSRQSTSPTASGPPASQGASASATPSATAAPETNQWVMAKFRPSTAEPSLSGTFRAFSGRPNYIADFPLTMNGCATRAMRTHWRSLGQEITIGTMYYSDTPDDAAESDATNLNTATSGWIDTGGCEQPVFFVPEGAASTLVDVTFETRIFEAAP